VEDATVELGYYRGPLDALLEGIDNAGLLGALIELDGAGAELVALIDERTSAYPDLVRHNERARNGAWRVGPIRFGGGKPTMPLEGDNLASVRALLARMADWDIAFHVAVRDEQGYLIEAPDVGDNVIFVSERLPRKALEAVRAALGSNLRSA
jgi:catechol 2,3-dioxygenase-like lactoylglutathione lyase family enzyme